MRQQRFRRSEALPCVPLIVAVDIRQVDAHPFPINDLLTCAFPRSPSVPLRYPVTRRQTVPPFPPYIQRGNGTGTDPPTTVFNTVHPSRKEHLMSNELTPAAQAKALSEADQLIMWARQLFQPANDGTFVHAWQAKVAKSLLDVGILDGYKQAAYLDATAPEKYDETEIQQRWYPDEPGASSDAPDDASSRPL